MSELLKIDVNEHTEKKNGLTYLSWAWAWAEVLKIDPQATWSASEFDGYPAAFSPDGSAMVCVAVTIKGHAKTCWLPVMDHRNKAIKNPDAFAVNTALMRCMTKCVSMHGLGLYIYAGEDLPEGDSKDTPKHSPRADIGADLPDDWKNYLGELAGIITSMVAESEVEAAVEKVRAEELEADQQTYLWNQLDSKTRAAMKGKK